MKRGRSRRHPKNVVLVHQDNFTPCSTETNLKRSFRSRNTEEVRSPPIKRVIAPVTGEQEKAEESEDEIFGEMITKMIAVVPEPEEKLRIQQDIVKTRYSFNRRYQGIPLSTNQCFYQLRECIKLNSNLSEN